MTSGCTMVAILIWHPFYVRVHDPSYFDSRFDTCSANASITVERAVVTDL